MLSYIVPFVSRRCSLWAGVILKHCNPLKCWAAAMPAVLTVQVGTQWPPEVEWCCIYCGIGHCLLLWRGYSTIQLEITATTVDRWGTRWKGGQVSWHSYPVADRNVMPWLLVYPPNIRTLMGNKKTHQIWIVVGSNRLLHLRLNL